jgi:hypothetical protein
MSQHSAVSEVVQLLVAKFMQNVLTTSNLVKKGASVNLFARLPNKDDEHCWSMLDRLDFLKDWEGVFYLTFIVVKTSYCINNLNLHLYDELQFLVLAAEDTS